MERQVERETLLRVLCVEDSPFDAELMRELLEDSGYRVQMDRVTMKDELVKTLRVGDYDVILADYNLPAFDAPAALKIAQELSPGIPFICVSGTIGEEAAVELLKQGCADYVLKDRMGRLAFAVQRALEGVNEQKARRQAEKSLWESQERYRELVENSHDVIYAFNADGTFTFGSPSLNDLLGYGESELSGFSYRDSIHPDDLPKWEGCLAKAASSGERQVGVEYRVKRADGSWRWHSSNIMPVMDPGGGAVSCVGNARDITQRKRMEARLALHATRLEILLGLHKMADAPEGAILDFVLAATLKVVESQFSWIGLTEESGDIATMYAWPDDEESGGATSRLPTGLSLSEAGPWGEAIRGRRPLVINDCDAAAIGKTDVPMGLDPIRRLLCVPVFDGERVIAVVAAANKEEPYDEEDVGALTSLMDKMWEIFHRRRDRERIEQLNRVLRAIREVNQLITREKDSRKLIEKTCRLLVETRGCGSALIVLTDGAGSPVAFAEAGLGEEFPHLAETLRQGVLPICCEDAENSEGASFVTGPAAFLSPCSLGEGCSSADSACIRLQHGKNSYGYMAVSMPNGIVGDEEERALLAELAGDIAFALRSMERETETANAEEGRRRAEAQLRQAQKMEALGTLAGGIAHDFNNILGIILGYAEMAGYETDEHGPLYAQLQEILKAAKRARNLVQQILAFSRRSEQEKKPVQVGLIVKEALKMLRASLPTTIEIDSAVDPQAIVMADPTQIHQVLMNLCANAAHAMMAGGGTLQVNLIRFDLRPEAVPVASALKPGPHVKLTVKDTGHGIDPVIIDRIFDPFFTTKETGVGTGLGLAVVHGIVESFGGHIGVESSPGKGTTFQVILPALETDFALETKAAAPLPRGKERILVVDDEPALAEIVKQMLERLGYEVDCRTDSLEALDVFRSRLAEKPFDLVITDMTMPQMTGAELARALLGIRPDLPVILCTGFSEKVSAERAASLGIQGFLLKPVVLKDLAELVRKVLDARVK